MNPASAAAIKRNNLKWNSAVGCYLSATSSTTNRTTWAGFFAVQGTKEQQHMNPTRMRGVVAALALSFFFVANANAQPGARDVSGLSDAQAEKLLALSAEFDRAYIPALALTNQQKQEPSEVAIARFREKGSAITREAISVLGLQPEDSQLWPTIQKAIDEAEELIREGQLMEAHEALEPLRAMLAADRRRLGLCYPLDLLNDYHETIEAIVKPATEATPDDVDGRTALGWANWRLRRRPGGPVSSRRASRRTTSKSQEPNAGRWTRRSPTSGRPSASSTARCATATAPPYWKPPGV